MTGHGPMTSAMTGKAGATCGVTVAISGLTTVIVGSNLSTTTILAAQDHKTNFTTIRGHLGRGWTIADVLDEML